MLQPGRIQVPPRFLKLADMEFRKSMATFLHQAAHQNTNYDTKWNKYHNKCIHPWWKYKCFGKTVTVYWSQQAFEILVNLIIRGLGLAVKIIKQI